jgi:hypothetical protein
MAEMEAVAQPDSVPIVHWETGRFPGHAVPGLLEIDSERARQAREFWDRAGVTDHIELVEGMPTRPSPGFRDPSTCSSSTPPRANTASTSAGGAAAVGARRARDRQPAGRRRGRPAGGRGGTALGGVDRVGPLAQSGTAGFGELAGVGGCRSATAWFRPCASRCARSVGEGASTSPSRLRTFRTTNEVTAKRTTTAPASNHQLPLSTVRKAAITSPAPTITVRRRREDHSAATARSDLGKDERMRWLLLAFALGQLVLGLLLWLTPGFF